MMKTKKIIKIAMILTIFFIIVLVLIGNYFVNFSLSKKAFKTGVSNQDHSTVKRDYKEEYFEKNKKEISIKSSTGVKLTGYELVVDENRPWVIVVHGYTGSAKAMGNYIYNFNKRNYNVFAPDLIAHGKSDGNFISMGSHDSKDIKKWIEFLNEKYNSPDIMLFGISMGAATIMNTIDENLPTNVKCFIEDSGYISLTDEFSYQGKKLFNLPYFPIVPISSMVTKVRAGYLFSDVNSTNALKNTKLPLLVLQGDKDTFVPYENAQKIYDIAKSPKMIYISKGAKHVEGAYMDSKNYWEHIEKFMSVYFK